MKVVVSGAGVQRTKELIQSANFFADILLGHTLASTIKLRIKIKSGIDVLGECGPYGSSMKRFVITLNRTNPEIVSTLAHEMVHLKQYAKGELGQIWEVTQKGMQCYGEWKGKLWKPSGKEDDYYDSPWEIEAYGREVGLYRRWLEHNK